MKYAMMALLAGLSGMAFAQQGAQGNFMQQQAYDEMRRVSGQVDILETNLSDLQQKVRKLESGAGNTSDKDLRAEIEALKSSVAELRRQMARQREEIVQDLTARLSKMQKQMTPPPPPKPTVTTKTIEIGPHKEYVVQSGDTLSIIAQAFNTNVAKIKEMNSLKSDNLRIGQKLKVPAN